MPRISGVGQLGQFKGTKCPDAAPFLLQRQKHNFLRCLEITDLQSLAFNLLLTGVGTPVINIVSEAATEAPKSVRNHFASEKDLVEFISAARGFTLQR